MELLFDIKINVDTSVLLGTYLCRVYASSEVRAISNMEMRTSLNIDLAHKLLGHHSKVQKRKIVKALGVRLTQDSMAVSNACDIAKAK